jgi:hypothetical protein
MSHRQLHEGSVGITAEGGDQPLDVFTKTGPIVQRPLTELVEA